MPRWNFSDKDKLYYKLKPVFDRDTTLYVSVGGEPEGKLSLRPVIGRDEALKLIRMMPEIEAKSYSNYKEQVQICREILYSEDQKERIALMKGIFKNGMKRKKAGKHCQPMSGRTRRRRKPFFTGN